MADPAAKLPAVTKVPGWLGMAAAFSWRILVVAAAVYLLAEAFGKLRLIMLPVIAALFMSSMLSVPAWWLRRRGLPPLVATWIVFLVAGVLVVGGMVLLVPGIAGEFGALRGDLAKGLGQAEAWLTTGPLHLSHGQVLNYLHKAGQEISANRTSIVQGALSGVTVLLQAAGVVVFALVLTFFFVKDSDLIGRWFLDLFSERRAADLRVVGRKAWRTLGGYVLGTAVNGLVNATVMSIGLIVLGVPLVIPIALLTFVGGFLPLIGGILSGLTAAVVALVARGNVAALFVLALTVLVHNLEGYLVGPLVLGRAVKLHPVAVLLALAAGSVLGGLIGAFIAVPVAAVLLSVNEHYRAARRTVPEVPPLPVQPLVVPTGAGGGAPEESQGPRPVKAGKA